MGKHNLWSVFGWLLALGLLILNPIKASALTLKCTDKNYCHPAVAALAIELKEEEGSLFKQTHDYCTAFLIDSNHIITNSHCVFGRLGNSRVRTRIGTSCVGVQVHFPQTENYPAEVATCIALEAIPDWDSRLSRGLPDYAVLRIETVKRPAIHIDKSGIKNLDPQTVVVYDFSNTKKVEEAVAIQRWERQCLPDMSNRYSYFDAFSPVAFYRNCHVIPGNSGSVILNSKGEATGVMAEKVTLAGQNTYAKDGVFEEAGLGTNLSCLDSFLGREKNPNLISSCGLENFMMKKTEISSLSLKEISTNKNKILNVDAIAEREITRYSRLFKLKYTPDIVYIKGGAYIRHDDHPRIECVQRRAAEWLPQGKIALPLFRVESVFNKQYKSVVQNLKQVLLVIDYKRVTPQNEVKKRNTIDVEMTLSEDGEVLKPMNNKVTIPICP